MLALDKDIEVFDKERSIAAFNKEMTAFIKEILAFVNERKVVSSFNNNIVVLDKEIVSYSR